jgi:NAD(P)-dependent dehydrogenase (short-subunit alcohol dehydrogenase family)
MKKVLITGAGTGFGHEAAIRLAEKGFDVVATVEIWAQVQTLKRQVAARGVTLQVEKLDVTNEGDRKKALGWDIEILVNNAGVLEGGSVLDIPGADMRHQFEVNVIGPLLLTQGIAKQMVKRGEGRVVWVSSREGLNTNPYQLHPRQRRSTWRRPVRGRTEHGGMPASNSRRAAGTDRLPNSSMSRSRGR